MFVGVGVRFPQSVSVLVYCPGLLCVVLDFKSGGIAPPYWGPAIHCKHKKTYLTLYLATREFYPCGRIFSFGNWLSKCRRFFKACSCHRYYRLLWCCGFFWSCAWLVVHLEVQASTFCKCLFLQSLAGPPSLFGPCPSGLNLFAGFFFFFCQYAAGLYGKNRYFVA